MSLFILCLREVHGFVCDLTKQSLAVKVRVTNTVLGLFVLFDYYYHYYPILCTAGFVDNINE